MSCYATTSCMKFRFVVKLYDAKLEFKMQHSVNKLFTFYFKKIRLRKADACRETQIL